MPDPTIANTDSIDRDPKTPVNWTEVWDYVVVAGLDKSSENMYNRARFINQAIRTLRLRYERDDNYPGVPKYKPPALPNGRKTRSVFILCRGDQKNGNFAQGVLDEVRKLVTEYYGALYIEAGTAEDIVNFINNRDPGSYIKELYFFAHGYPGSIELGYHLPDKDQEENYQFNASHAARLRPGAFATGAKICSYACRTGLGNPKRGITEFDSKTSPMYEKSLAQIIANAARVTVYAFAVRSEYKHTYGSRDIINRVLGLAGQSEAERMEKKNKANAEVLKEYDGKKKTYDSQKLEYDKKNADYQSSLADYNNYQKRLADYRKTKGNEAALSLPGEAPPSKPAQPVPPVPPKAPEMSSEDGAQARNFMREQEMGRKERAGLPILAEGAVREVVAGDTPKGLPTDYREYRPSKGSG